jgi:hypothetical protein
VSDDREDRELARIPVDVRPEEKDKVLVEVEVRGLAEKDN